MQRLLSTTAIVVALGFPAMTLAETTYSGDGSETQQESGEMSGFLAERGQSDLYASDLMGHAVHARRMSGDKAESEDQASADENGDGRQNMATMNRSDLDDMDSIGEINEIVLSDDGEVRAFVIGVGGFLGMGERNVAVTMDQVTFTTDAEDESETFIIVNTGKDQLENAPAYETTAALTGESEGNEQDRTERTTSDDAADTDGQDQASDDAAENDGQNQVGDDAAENDGQGRAGDRAALAAPDIEREGYDRVEAKDISAEMLMEKTVYDLNDNDVGDVTDMILDDEGKITDIVIDFGGFLGIGSNQVSLQFKELTIMANDGYEDVRLYVDADKEEIQNLPKYMASN